MIGLEAKGRNQSDTLPGVTLGMICFTDNQETAVAIDWNLQLEVAYHLRAVVNMNGEIVWSKDDELAMVSFTSPDSDLFFVHDAEEDEFIERLRELGDELAYLLILVDRHPLEDRSFDEVGGDWLLEGTSTGIENLLTLCSNS